jgi:hypothetical protein
VPFFYFLLQQSTFHHFTFLSSQGTCHFEPYPEGRVTTA